MRAGKKIPLCVGEITCEEKGVGRKERKRERKKRAFLSAGILGRVEQYQVPKDLLSPGNDDSRLTILIG